MDPLDQGDERLRQSLLHRDQAPAREVLVGIGEQRRDRLLRAGHHVAGLRQLGLGALYEAGQGVPAVDFGQALVWYRAAAAQGLPAAQNNLALLYAGGVITLAMPGVVAWPISRP